MYHHSLDIHLFSWQTECAIKMDKLKQERDKNVRRRTGQMFFHHIHKAGGTTLCAVAKHNLVCDMSKLPKKKDWNTNCVPRGTFCIALPPSKRSHCIFVGDMFRDENFHNF